MADRVITVPQATQIAQATKRQLTELNGRLDLELEQLFETQTVLDVSPSNRYAGQYIYLSSGKLAGAGWAGGDSVTIPLDRCGDVLKFGFDKDAAYPGIAQNVFIFSETDGVGATSPIYYYSKANVVNGNASMEATGVDRSHMSDGYVTLDVAKLKSILPTITSIAINFPTGSYLLQKVYRHEDKEIPWLIVTDKNLDSEKLNDTVSYAELEKNHKYYTPTLTVGYCSSSDGSTRTDIKRGVFTELIRRTEYYSAQFDSTDKAIICLYDENENYKGVYYNSNGVPESCYYIRLFIVPKRTNGNATAMDEEIQTIKDSLIVWSSTTLFAGKDQIVVATDGSGDYTTISAAVDAAKNGDTIFINDGEYKETVIINKFLHLVGASKQGTILYQNIGDYNNCPLLITQGSVSNMTIKSIAPSDVSGLSDYAYAIHLDKNFASDAKYQKCEIFNCDIYSEVNDAIGAGTNYATEYDVHDCFIHVASNPVKTGSCGFKCHNGTGQTGGKVTLKNNVIITEDADGTTAYDVLYHNGGISNVQPIDVLQVGNVLKHYKNSVPTIFVPLSYNFGNSVAEMNTLTV